MFNQNIKRAVLLLLLAKVVYAQDHANADTEQTIPAQLSLFDVVMMAQQNDPWLHASQLQQQATINKSVAAGTLPNSKISLQMMNLPVDSWQLEQEGMTQVKVGISQMFPRGDSLAIKEQQLSIKANKFPLLRADRKAKLETKVSELWLTAYLAQQTIRLIEDNETLFTQMAEVARANYSNVVGKTRQQDVIRAQLEIIQLQDRLTVEKQKFESALASLNEWLQPYDDNSKKQIKYFDSNFAFNQDEYYQPYTIAKLLPDLELKKPSLLHNNHLSLNQLANLIFAHPAILALEVNSQASAKNIELAKQAYKGQWAINASYGYRDNMPSGQSRSDLFSLGISYDLPLFSNKKQDQLLAAAIANTEAIKTEKLLLTKQMVTALEKELRQLKRLRERQSLYQDLLVKQTHQQAEASLTAYTNDDGDFAEVVRARIAELNTNISALQIDVQLLKTITRINYYFAKAPQNEQNKAKSLVTEQYPFAQPGNDNHQDNLYQKSEQGHQGQHKGQLVKTRQLETSYE